MKAVFSIVLLCVLNLSAASWYAGSSGSGSANGTSWANRWALESVTWGGGGVAAGDTLYLDGGATSQTYTGSYTVGAGGTAGNPITISASADSGHDGLILFDKDASGDAAGGVILTVSQNHVTITGGANNRMVFQNQRNTNDNVGCAAILGATTTNLVIQHVNFTNCNIPIWVAGSIGTEVGWCNLWGVRGDAGVRLVASVGGWDANLVYSNVIQQLWSTNKPAGSAYAYAGPDGVQTGSGVSIFGNSFRVDKNLSIYTSSQHPDTIQFAGNFGKIYANTFINNGDSNFDFDGYSNPTPSNIWIFNNVFRIEDPIDNLPEAIRFYITSGGMVSFTGIKILNNLFDQSNTLWQPIKIMQYNGGNPTATGCEIKNNVFYRSGGDDTHQFLYIEASTGFTAADWDTDANIYHNETGGTQYLYVDGTNYTATAWLSANEPNGSASLPSFVNAAAGDYTLTALDTVAKGRGVDLSAYFTADHDGATRTVPWDIGPFKAAATDESPGTTNRVTFGRGTANRLHIGP